VIAIEYSALFKLQNLLRQLAEPTTENFSDKEIDSLVKKLVRAEYRANEHFSTPNAPNTYIAYIAKGLFRLYLIDQYGKEATHDFTGEGLFMSSYGAIILNKIFPMYIQALEDSEIYLLSRDEFIYLWQNDLRWKNILQKTTEFDSLELRNREMGFLLYDAQTRYAHFLDRYERYAERIKLRYTASYLGISPETLSRIRKNTTITASDAQLLHMKKDDKFLDG